MAVITNTTTSGSINTATDLIPAQNQYGRVKVQNQDASAAIFVNVGAPASSTGTIAGESIAAGQSDVFTVNGRQLSVASGTASVKVAFWEFIDQ